MERLKSHPHHLNLPEFKPLHEKKLFGGAPIPGTSQRMQGQLTTRGKKQRNMIHTVKQLLQQAKCLIQAKSSYSNLPNIRLKIP